MIIKTIMIIAMVIASIYIYYKGIATTFESLKAGDSGASGV